jgi:hypothetical protein
MPEGLPEGLEPGQEKCRVDVFFHSASVFR